MPKGLPKSLSRGETVRQSIIKKRIAVNTTVTVSATGAAIGFGSAVLEGLPECYIGLLGAVGRFSFSGSGSDANLVDTWSGDFGVGTTPADDATITGNDVDVLPSTPIGAATAEVIATQLAANAGTDLIDNTSGTRELNLNLLIDAANITDDESVDITVEGTLELVFITLGDD